jgi:restriction endonuclease Mrr
VARLLIVHQTPSPHTQEMFEAVLADGARLAELLVQYGVGVQPEQTVTLFRLDEDFFDSI